jgi:hypothetical protein
MERFVIDVLQACQTVKGACSLIGITRDQAWHVLERAVARGLSWKNAVEIARIGVNEKAFRKGHRSMTIVSDSDRGTVDYVSDGREKVGLSAYFSPRTPQQITAIEAVAGGMSERTASSWATTSAGTRISTADTARVFCTVTSLTTLGP